jgi:hypothetical protein
MMDDVTTPKPQFGDEPIRVKKLLITARDINDVIVGQEEASDIPLIEVVDYLIKGVGVDLVDAPETKNVIIVMEFGSEDERRT